MNPYYRSVIEVKERVKSLDLDNDDNILENALSQRIQMLKQKKYQLIELAEEILYNANEGDFLLDVASAIHSANVILQVAINEERKLLNKVK